jgi:hypothetical protein
VKNSRRLSTRHDKLIESFAAFVLRDCIRISIRFVRTASSVAIARRRHCVMLHHF